MDTDLLLIVGVFVALLSVPAIISAFGAGRPPRAATITAAVGGALIVLAIANHPGGYRAQELPAIAERVFDRYVN